MHRARQHLLSTSNFFCLPRSSFWTFPQTTAHGHPHWCHFWMNEVISCSPRFVFLIDKSRSSTNFSLSSKDPLRRRFSNALQWFTLLCDITDRQVNDLINKARVAEVHISPDLLASSRTLQHSMMTPLFLITPTIPPATPSADGSFQTPSSSTIESTPQPPITPSAQRAGDCPTDTRPSNYLRSKCALCFGGDITQGSLPWYVLWMLFSLVLYTYVIF